MDRCLYRVANPLFLATFPSFLHKVRHSTAHQAFKLDMDMLVFRLAQSLGLGCELNLMHHQALAAKLTEDPD